ncbi:metallophosphoesterase [Streptomyces sp. NPDC048623]|uniref:metallophosphoesterase n=1 Tax=Streptomyces sp. NPDC048623 TaxID=3155761 RepID=UPI00342C0075
MQELIATGCFHSAVPEGRAVLAAVRAAKTSGALVIDAGDFFGGSAFHTFSQGRVEQRLLTDLYDAVVPGNHDFADLLRLQDPAAFPPVVCANVRPHPDFRGHWVAGLVLAGARRRVGIVGYMGRQAFDAIPAAEREGFEFTTPTADLLAAQAAPLRAQGAEVVVGVSHSGFLSDVADQEADWPIHVVVASHCHSPWSLWSKGGRHVAKPPANGAGLLRLLLRPEGPQQAVLESPAPSTADDGLEQEVTAFGKWAGERLGSLPRPLPDRRDVAAALGEHARSAPGVDAFLLNTYALRKGMPAGVTRGDLFACAPFDSELVTLDRPHRLDALIDRASELGEDTVACSNAHAVDETTITTTRYLAERLAVAWRPLDPPCSLHGLLIDLVRESR